MPTDSADMLMLKKSVPEAAKAGNWPPKLFGQGKKNILPERDSNTQPPDYEFNALPFFHLGKLKIIYIITELKDLSLMEF